MKRFHYLAPAAVLVVFWAAGVGAGDDKPDPAAELKALEGNWQETKEEARGNPTPKPVVANQWIAIDGAKMSWYMGNPAPGQVADIQVDPTTNPKSIDAVITQGSDKDKKMLGIYKLNKDTLEICWSEPGSDKRPKKFTSTGAGAGLVYAKFEPKKDK
jgi:uncharacterized protein (TIGR03067 family)